MGKNEPIALEQRDQKQLKRHLSQKDEEISPPHCENPEDRK
jgi:hypothetical protein